MGLKGLMSGMGMNVFGMISLVLAASAFVAIVIWTFTRPRKELETYSRLWEEEEDHVRT